MKKAIINLGMMGLLLLLLCSPSYADSFSEQYPISNLKAFLKDGRILFEQRDSGDRTAVLICIGEDEQKRWAIELPWSEYGGSILGQAGDDILYGYRASDDPALVLNRYSDAGELLSAHAMPKDAGRGFLANEYVYFISEGSLKFCDANGSIHSISTENVAHFESLFRVAGNENRLVFLLSTKTAKGTECVLLALDQSQRELWTYPLEGLNALNANQIHLAMASDGRVCIADFSGEEVDGFRFTLLNEWGSEMWRKEIVPPVGENAWLSLIRMNDDETMQLWGSARTSAQSISSWKMTMDYDGKIIEKGTYPNWVDVIVYRDEEPYGVLDPLGTPALMKEMDIDWAIQK